jgi:hypothetical protein
MYNDRIEKLREKIAESKAPSDSWWLIMYRARIERLARERDSIKVELEKLNEN